MNKIIKTISDGNLTLEHSRWRDDFGILRDSFQIIETKENGHKVYYPFIAHFKVRTYRKDESITDATNDYTEEEYRSMLWSFKPQ